MCDTIAVVGDEGVLFAKNSDRDANEAQHLQWQDRAEHPAGATCRCTYLEIPQVRRTHAVLLSRPFWIWGAEMGANEHGVVIGNEAVFTREALAKSGLTGMDLLRLALERADTARRAVEVIVELVQVHGQGGGCGHENRRFSYHNSFLAADPREALVLETAGRKWAVEEVQGARSISNALSIPGFAERHSDFLYTRVARGRTRRQITEAAARTAGGPAEMMAILRSHGPKRSSPDYNWLSGSLSAPCVHAGGLAVGSQTTASWVAELSPSRGISHWVTATAAPCTGLFKPVRVDRPLSLGPWPTDRADPETLWWRHEVLHRRVMRDPGDLLPLYCAERDEVERQWLASPPEPARAFALADELLARWERATAGRGARDRRPLIARRYWRIRNRRAGLLSD